MLVEKYCSQVIGFRAIIEKYYLSVPIYLTTYILFLLNIVHRQLTFVLRSGLFPEFIWEYNNF